MKFQDLNIGDVFVFQFEHDNRDDCEPIFSCFTKEGINSYSNKGCNIIQDNRRKKNNKFIKIVGWCHPNIDVYNLEKIRYEIKD